MNFSKNNISCFSYDPFGRRILKISKPCTAGVPGANTTWTYTYYVNDASGNVMATYSYDKGASAHTMTLDEQMVYGGSRLGLRDRNKLLSTFTISGSVLTHTSADETQRTLGSKRYEFTNHLGNVLLVTTDRKMSKDPNTNGTTDYYHCVVDAYYDYGPFGNVLEGRSYGTGYRYGFNGQEGEEELYGTGNATSAEYWMYDARLGRRWNVDPMKNDYRLTSWSPYHISYDNPIVYSDKNGNIPWNEVLKYIRVSSQQGWRTHPISGDKRYHGGMDLAANSGTNVMAMASGQIALIGWDPNGYGNYLVIKHPNGYFTLYAHLESINGKVGDEVVNAQVVAKSGNTGGSTGPHLHLEVIKADKLADIYNKKNKLDPETIGDLEELVNPGFNSYLNYFYQGINFITDYLDPVSILYGSYELITGSISESSSRNTNSNSRDQLQGTISYTVTTSSDPLRFYSTSSSSKSTDAIPKGAIVLGDGVTEGGRTQVMYNGQIGWVSSDYLKENNSEKENNSNNDNNYDDEQCEEECEE